MMALLRKELGELSPLLAAIAVAALCWIYAHTLQPLRSLEALEAASYLIDDWCLFSLLLAFLAGHSRLRPEFSLGTITFLDGLPISRSRIYGAKVAAGGVICLTLVLATAAIKVWALSHWPGDASLSVGPLLAVLTLWFGLFVYCFYGIGLLLSWLGTLGWVMLLLGLMSLLILSVPYPAVRPYFPLMNMLDFSMNGAWPTPSPGPLLVWWATGSMGIGLSWLLFLGPGERLVSTASAWAAIAKGVVVAIPSCGMTLLGITSAFGLSFSLSTMFQPVFSDATDHFRFLAFESHRTEAETVIRSAEQIRADLTTLYEHDGPERLDIELTGASEIHAGQFIPGKIQLRSTATPEILAHELAHAWSYAVAEDDYNQDAWRFFEEGLADWVAAQIRGLPLEKPTLNQLGRCGQSDWLLLFEDQRRTQHLDPDGVYPLGNAFAQALDRAGGHGTALCVSRARRDLDDPHQDGLPLWRDLTAACQTDLDAVVQAYEDAFGTFQVLDEHAPQITRVGDTLYLTFPEATQPISCRARADASDARTTYTDVSVINGICELEAWEFNHHMLDLQLSHTTGTDPYCFGPWHQVAIPR